ncbi:MAG: penicillin-binding protein 2 [Acidobacteria bacterium]|nr:penicillin-binding protein 2 [Acidobacteriota bacterium]
MNRSIRRVALALGLAFAALLANLNLVQVSRSSQILGTETAKEWNRRRIINEYSTERGTIVAGGEVVAESRTTRDALKYVRRYPLGDLFGQISGYYSFRYGAWMVESKYNGYLTGDEPSKPSDLLDDFLGRPRRGNTVVLTIDPELQRIARAALGRQRGGVAAIDPETGEVLALWGNPSYDPGPLSTHDFARADRAWSRLNADPAKPLLSRAFREHYPPGSTFKIITAAAALELGKMTPATRLPFDRALHLPGQSKPVRNFGGSTCGGSVRRALLVSCNTAFARIGLRLGWKKLYDMATRFGLNRESGLDIPAAPSCLRTIAGECSDPSMPKAEVAKSAFGQQNVRVTPLQMALVAAAVQNGGYLVRPHVVREVQDYSGFVVRRFAPAREGPVYSRKVAKWLREMMIDVVRFGTGRVVGFRGRGIGGKTGTAQTGVEGEAPHVWFVAFAPGIAVAVVVEHGGDLRSEATGGKVAGPIARKVIEAFQRTAVR